MHHSPFGAANQGVKALTLGWEIRRFWTKSRVDADRQSLWIGRARAGDANAVVGEKNGRSGHRNFGHVAAGAVSFTHGAGLSGLMG